MLRVNQNSLNYITLTLDEKATLASPNYLLQLKSNQSDESKVVRLSGDTSVNTSRYNRFPLTLSGSSSEDLDLGIINLVGGTYDYYAWETSASTLSLTAATAIVESGEFIVASTGTTSDIIVSGQTYISKDGPSGYIIRD